MAGMFRLCALGIVAIYVLSGLIIVGSVSAQSIPKLSTPEFTLKYLVTEFTISPYSTINPYTGENQTLSPGYTGSRRSIEVSAKNQAFSPYSDAEGNYVELYYNVSFKGHYDDVWSHYPDGTYEDLFNASSSAYTVIEVSLEPYPSIPQKAQLDFRLQTIIGHYNYDTTPSGTKYVTGFTALETSNWSSTQTITIGEESNTQAPTNTVPEFPMLAVLCLLVVVPLIATVLMHKRKQA